MREGKGYPISLFTKYPQLGGFLNGYRMQYTLIHSSILAPYTDSRHESVKGVSNISVYKIPSIGSFSQWLSHAVYTYSL